MIHWPNTEIRALERTRKIISAYQGHHKCAAVERLYLPREKGGRGLVFLEQLWEREQISAIQYLQQSHDPWLKGVLNFMAELCESENKNSLATSRTILRKYAISIPETESDVRQLTRVCTSQHDLLLATLRAKNVHGAHCHTVEDSRVDQGLTFWVVTRW